MYSGTAIGMAWIVVGPLLLLALYATIYAVIFQIRVPNFTIHEYVLNVFSGLVPFLAFAQALSTGASALQAGQGLLANVNFVAEMIPARAVAVAYVMLPVGRFEHQLVQHQRLAGYHTLVQNKGFVAFQSQLDLALTVQQLGVDRCRAKRLAVHAYQGTAGAAVDPRIRPCRLQCNRKLLHDAQTGDIDIPPDRQIAVGLDPQMMRTAFDARHAGLVDFHAPVVDQ